MKQYVGKKLTTQKSETMRHQDIYDFLAHNTKSKITQNHLQRFCKQYEKNKQNVISDLT